MTADDAPGVVLMTYGSPATWTETSAPYITRVRGGREPIRGAAREFARRYATIGMSPLIEITRPRRGLEDRARLAASRSGMRFSEPSIASGLRAPRRRGGSTTVAAIILSPQYSPMLMGGYANSARGRRGDRRRPARSPSRGVAPAAGVHRGPGKPDPRGLADVPADDRRRRHVLLTAHSLPKRVVDREPGYVEQLQETAQAVARGGQPGAERWRFC